MFDAADTIRQQIAQQEAPPEDHQPSRRISLIKASSVLTERLDFLIDSWVPRRSLTLLAGREGLGKSTIACGIAAQATRGELNSPPMNVAYLNTEDSRSITVKPRLEAAGADMDRVFFIDVTTEVGNTGALNLPGDTSLLAKELVANNVGLVILDAAKSAMHSSLDGYRDDDVRQFLEPLSAMCDENNMVVIGLVHFGKRESNDPGKLILGSVAWSQIARSVLSVAVNDEGTLIVTNTKANLAPGQISREATLESVTIPVDSGGTTDVGRIVWGDNTDVSAADLLVSHESQSDERGEAESVVVGYLEDQGGSAPAGDVRKQVMAAGLEWKTVQNNRRKWGVVTSKGASGWEWSLEAHPEGPDQGPVHVGVGTLGSSQVTGLNQGPEHARSQHPVHGDLPGPSPELSFDDTASTDEIDAVVLGTLTTDHALGLSTIVGSVPKNHRDQVESTLQSLASRQLITCDDRGRYVLAS